MIRLWILATCGRVAELVSPASRDERGLEVSAFGTYRSSKAVDEGSVRTQGQESGKARPRAVGLLPVSGHGDPRTNGEERQAARVALHRSPVNESFLPAGSCSRAQLPFASLRRHPGARATSNSEQL